MNTANLLISVYPLNWLNTLTIILLCFWILKHWPLSITDCQRELLMGEAGSGLCS